MSRTEVVQRVVRTVPALRRYKHTVLPQLVDRPRIRCVRVEHRIQYPVPLGRRREEAAVPEMDTIRYIQNTREEVYRSLYWSYRGVTANRFIIGWKHMWKRVCQC